VDKQLKELFLPYLEPMKISSTSFLYQEGEGIKGIYVVEKGRILLSKRGNRFQNTWLGFAKVGGVLALESLEGSLHMNSAQALTNTEVSFIKKETVELLFEQKPNINLVKVRKLCQVLQESERKAYALLNKNSRQRFAMMLLEIISTYGFSKNNQLQIPLNLKEMASLVGTTSRNLSKIIEEFTLNGWLERDKEKFSILNQFALEASLN